MRRSAWIFLAAILLPSLGLAWLAFHSVRDQQVVLEHQEAIICQNQTDALAKDIQQQMDAVRLDFVTVTQRLEEASTSPRALAGEFNPKLRAAWPLAEIGFAVDLNGEIYSPQPREDTRARQFRNDNDRFLSNRENAEVYYFNGNQSQGYAANSVATDATGNRPDNLASAKTLYRAAGKSSKEGQELKSKAAAPASATTADMLSPRKTNEQLNKVVAEEAKKQEANKPASDLAATRAPEQQTAAAAGAVAQQADTSQASGKDLETQRERDDLKGGETARPAAAPAAPSAALALPDANAAAPAAQAQRAPSLTQSIAPPATARPPAKAEDNDALNAPADEAPTSMPGLQQLSKIARNVVPQQKFDKETVSLSNTVPAESDFQQVIGTEPSGELARFLDNKLCLIVWSHTPPDSPIVFGAQIDKMRLIEKLQSAFQIPELQYRSYGRSSGNNYCLAILDDSGHPVAVSRTGFKADWKHPFVATEIGEALPHWEAALYLVDPQQINRTARTLQFTLGLIVLLLVAAIVAGGSLIAADVRRQVRLAQQKTDFVSNVSHELKTPLTSIRMFADLLAEKRVPDEARQSTYLRIIAAEAARLTRLINNVLDFARLERGAPTGEHQACDLVEAVRDVIETCQPHLETSGIAFRSEIEAESLPVTGDRDALAQIILNLVSNAEKYGGNDITVRVRRQETAAGALGCVDVLDRGAGISARDMKTIFEPFHRLDDSLSSGIPGSGLGLTLARRMARAHGGDVTCSARAGGGSCFTLSVPLAPNQPPSPS